MLEEKHLFGGAFFCGFKRKLYNWQLYLLREVLFSFESFSAVGIWLIF
jgi:hypothetical protein